MARVDSPNSNFIREAIRDSQSQSGLMESLLWRPGATAPRAPLEQPPETSPSDLLADRIGKGETVQAGLRSPQDTAAEGLRCHRVSLQRGHQHLREGEEWQLAFDLLGEMTKVGIERDVFSYSSAVSASEKGGEWLIGLKLFQEMAWAQVQRSVVTYNAAMSACQKGGGSGIWWWRCSRRWR